MTITETDFREDDECRNYFDRFTEDLADYKREITAIAYEAKHITLEGKAVYSETYAGGVVSGMITMLANVANVPYEAVSHAVKEYCKRYGLRVEW